MAAPIVLTDCHISINDVVYSGQGTNVAISYGAEALDTTPFGNETREHIGGIKEWSIAVEGNADEATTGAAFFNMVGTIVPLEVRPTSADRSDTNPGYRGLGLCTDYSPLDGGVGDAHSFSLSFVSAGPLTRVIDPLAA